MKLKIWVALLVVYIVWGSTYLAIRFAVETIPPFFVAGSRALLAGTILYIWRRLAGDPAPTGRQWLAGALVGLLLLLGGNGLVSWAEQKVASGVAALLVGSAPLWMAAIEALRPGGVRPNWLGILGVTIGFCGIFLLVGPSLFDGKIADVQPLGIGALLLASLLWSLGSITSRTANLPSSALMSTSVEMLTGSAGLFIIGALAGEGRMLHITAVSLRSWLSLAYLTIFGSLIAFTAYAWLLREAPLTLVSTYAYVNPLVAVILGSWLAQEVLNARILVAALVIIGSVVVINVSRLGKAVSPRATAETENT